MHRLATLFTALVIFLCFTRLPAFAESTVTGGWERLDPVPQANALLSTHFVNSSTGWAVGQAGTILKTADGGATWQVQASGTANDLLSVQFVNTNTGLAVGTSGTILKTTDGGSTWIPQTSGTSNGITAIHCVDANTCYAVTQRAVLKTINGGTNWISTGIAALDNITSVHFVNANTGWIAGESVVLKTVDGGVTWNPQYLPPDFTGSIRSIHFLDASTGWAADDSGAILRTTNGSTWTVQNSGTNNALRCIHFASSSLGMAVGDNGAILRSTDGGQHWSAQLSGITADLNSVYYLDGYIAWAVGSGGVILRTQTAGLPGCVMAKQAPIGRALNFGNLVVTAKFPGCIYAEHPGRNMGIRINTTDMTPNEGDMIYVHGTTALTGPERSINATSIDITTHGWGHIAPLAMNNKSVGGGRFGFQNAMNGWRTNPDGTQTQWQGIGLNNVGMLVRAWGAVQLSDSSTITIDDGSGIQIKCVLPANILANPSWTYATLTGVVSCESVGSEIHPVILVTSVDNATAKAPNYDQSPFGCNFLKWEFLKNNSNVWTDLSNRIRIMKDAGIYWDRDGIGWRTVEPVPGSGNWDWTFTDQVVQLCKTNGINLIPILSAPASSPPLTDTDRANFANYVYQVVNRYKDWIKVWEIWNEPNETTFWKNPNVAQYTLMLIEAYKAAKRADPTCTVISGGVVGMGIDWFKGIHDNGGWDYCDGVAIHPYAQVSNPIRQRLDLILRTTNNFIAGYGKPKPVWVTEAGWKSNSTSEEQGQAINVFQTYVICLANHIQNFDYFCVDNYDGWGIIHDVGYIPYPCSPKPAYTAVKQLTQALGSPGATAQFEGYLQMPANMACYVFKKTGTSRVLIFWNMDGVTRSIQLPQAAGLSARDMLGNPITITQGAFMMGALPVIISGADSTQIGPVSVDYNPNVIPKGTNIIYNGTLDCTPPSYPGSWSVGRFNTSGNTGTFTSSTAGHNGTCVSISNSTGQGAWSGTVVPVEPGKSYTISGWIKTQNSTGTNCIAIDWYAGNMFSWKGEARTTSYTGTRNWTYVSATGTAGPDTAFIHVFLISDSNSGTTSFDDISVVEN